MRVSPSVIDKETEVQCVKVYAKVIQMLVSRICSHCPLLGRQAWLTHHVPVYILQSLSSESLWILSKEWEQCPATLHIKYNYFKWKCQYLKYLGTWFFPFSSADSCSWCLISFCVLCFKFFWAPVIGEFLGNSCTFLWRLDWEVSSRFYTYASVRLPKPASS